MTDHVRKQIRDRVVVELTGLASTGARVYPQRKRPAEASKLPCLLVYINREVSDRDTLSAPRGMLRKAELVVEGLARAAADVEAALETVAKEIEAAIGTSTLNGLAKDLVLAATDFGASGEGDREHGFVRLTFNVLYRTREGAPTAVA